MARVIGPDVSFYQDDPETPAGIDFVKMKASAGYVIIRAGQNTWPDPDFKYNWREAKKAGLPRGSYWFYDSRTEPKKQAELWVSLFEGDFGELPLFADFEENYKGNYAGWRNWYTFLERLKQLAPQGKEISIYTAYYYWRDNAPNPVRQPQAHEYFHQYPLWIANYGASEPAIPSPWKAGEWLFWQFTESGDGKLYGVESNGIDLNYFNGDVAALRARYKLSDSPTPPDNNTGGSNSGAGQRHKVNTSALRVRQGPGTNYSILGMVYYNEVVLELSATNDRSWIKVRTKDNLEGWCAADYLVLTNDPFLGDTSGTDPDPNPQPEPDPTPVRKFHKVTTSALRVRAEPNTTSEILGRVYFNEVVEELGANADRSWLKIRNKDNLTGWCSADYLISTNETIPPADGGGTTDPGSGGGTPDPVTDKYYKVTTASLRVRAGPGTTFESVGNVYFGEVVKQLDITSDGSWVKISGTGDVDIKGWVSILYLIPTTETQTPDQEISPIIPSDEEYKWYKVTASTMYVRESNSSSSPALGFVVAEDTLPGLDDTSDPNFIKIRRVDGLTGWVSRKYMTLISNDRPTSTRQVIFTGVTYLRKEITTPRKNVINVLAIDLSTYAYEFFVTPGNSNGTICTRTTSKFVEEFKLHIGINGDGFSYVDTTANPGISCSNGGDPVRPNGLAASRGTVYSQVKNAQPTIYINNRSAISFAPTATIFNAVSGDRMVVADGAIVKNLAENTPNPRTAIGLSKNGRWLLFFVIDGRQPEYSEGVTLPELASIMISYGTHIGVNMDGGGSSSMVIKGVDGKARVLNMPIDMNVQGKERRVANHLGIFVKK